MTSTAVETNVQATQTMLAAKELFCERDERILFQNLNFALDAGQVLQVQGSNGSGKTTLLRILCGLNDGYEGSIYWHGEAIRENRDDFYKSLLYIGHRVGVNKVLSPLQNLRWSCSLQCEVDEAELYEALATVGLRGFEESQCFTLSAGQQQRVSLARLLISPASLWVLDEPFTTLDTKGIKQVEQLLKQHTNAGGAAMVTTHHKLDVPALNVLSLG